MRKLVHTVSWLVILTVFTLGCNRVLRISSSQTTDLSGRWNDEDARLVVAAMIKNMIPSPWLEKFMCINGNRLPVIMIGPMLNETDEHINLGQVAESIGYGLLNTATVRIVAHGIFREMLRKEKIDQQSFASPETQKRLGHELGADLVMCGTMNKIEDRNNRDKVVYYQFNSKLVNLETNEVVWAASKEIKKYLGGKRIKKKYRGKENKSARK